MGNVVSIQKVVDGVRNAILKVDVSLDGSGDIVIPQTIVDINTLSPGLGRRLDVRRLEWSIPQGLTLNLFWDGAGPAPLYRMNGSEDIDNDDGGLQNNADQPNGKITLTTNSMTPGVPLNASFKIQCNKKTIP